MLNNLPKFFCIVLCTVICFSIEAQHQIKMDATLREDMKTIMIQQSIRFENNTEKQLEVLYFNDWNNAYASRKSPLTIRLTEEFKKNLFLARNKDKGNTCINGLHSSEQGALHWDYLEVGDIIAVRLKQPLAVGEAINLHWDYEVKIPNAKFTGYGYHTSGYNLRYWYIWPCVYEAGSWKLYSNKNLNDGYFNSMDYSIRFKYPKKYALQSSLPFVQQPTDSKYKEITIDTEKRKESRLYLFTPKDKTFQIFQTPYLKLITDFKVRYYPAANQAVSVVRLTDFLSDYLGKYPYEHLLVTQSDYDRNPLYGLNQLPRFMQPYSEQFQFELGLLKTLLNTYLEETIENDPRASYWIKDAYHNYLLMLFIEKYYPNSKLIGSFAGTKLFRGFQVAKVGFNQQYSLFYNVLSRRNQEQSLVTPKDSLIKYNFQIANRYKAGLGMVYLADYIGKDTLLQALKEFYAANETNTFSDEEFQQKLQSSTDKPIDWFFDTYVKTNKSIDFKIKDITVTNDSVSVSIKNRTKAKVPVSLYGLKNKNVLSKSWIMPKDTSVIDLHLPKNEVDKLVLNFEKHIPEINERNNWKSLNGFFGNGKKLKLTLFKDIENPFYNQLFYVPIVKYNFYDGITLGMRLNNKSFLKRPFVYDIRPSYGFKSKSFVGSGTINYQHFIKNQAFYVFNVGLGGSSFHYAPDLRFYSVSPSVSFGFRPKDLRANKRDFISLRYVNIFRDKADASLTQNVDPDYNVLNLRFFHMNNNVIDHLGYKADVQYSSKFSKVSFNIDYRKLFQNKTQLNLRFFFGKFLRNNTEDNYFSYALDRPTDYLFEYNYYGRSENSGLFSQQIIIAEGGFKSKLDNPYANDWIATTNMSVNLWKWVELYGDVGFIRNYSKDPRFVYDSGIRLNLLTDYFELYFPLYSNNGWEIGQPNYDERIRFVVTLSPRTLIGLFTRKWF